MTNNINFNNDDQSIYTDEDYEQAEYGKEIFVSNDDEIDLEQSDELKNKNIIQKFIKHKKHKYLKIELNHKYDKSTIILPTNNINNWTKFHDTLDKEFDRKGIKDKEDVRLIHNDVDKNHELILGIYNNEEESSEKEDSGKDKFKKEVVVFKYSQMDKGSLHEAVLVNDLPRFSRYDRITQTFELKEKIEENNRILVPPNEENYPSSPPYSFESNEE